MWILFHLMCSGCHYLIQSVIKFATITLSKTLPCFLDFERQARVIEKDRDTHFPYHSLHHHFVPIIDLSFTNQLSRDLLLISIWLKAQSVFREGTSTALLAEVHSLQICYSSTAAQQFQFFPDSYNHFDARSDGKESGMIIWQRIMWHVVMGFYWKHRAPAHSFSNSFLRLLEELCKRSNLKAMSSRNVFQMDLSHHFCSSWHT